LPVIENLVFLVWRGSAGSRPRYGKEKGKGEGTEIFGSFSTTALFFLFLAGGGGRREDPESPQTMDIGWQDT
jgi:hypothetical protein